MYPFTFPFLGGGERIKMQKIINTPSINAKKLFSLMYSFKIFPNHLSFGGVSIDADSVAKGDYMEVVVA
jgi:hypothetical protein